MVFFSLSSFSLALTLWLFIINTHSNSIFVVVNFCMTFCISDFWIVLFPRVDWMFFFSFFLWLIDFKETRLFYLFFALHPMVNTEVFVSWIRLRIDKFRRNIFIGKLNAMEVITIHTNIFGVSIRLNTQAKKKKNNVSFIFPILWKARRGWHKTHRVLLCVYA